MATFNTDTSIFSDAENTLKQNAQGQKPYRYFMQSFDSAAGSTFTSVGQRRGGNSVSVMGPRAEPTSLNELPTVQSLPVNSAFLGKDTVSQKKIDAHSELRWGGKIRCKKGQQLLSESKMHRNDFIPPQVKSQGYETSEMVPVDPDFVRGDGLVIPNFQSFGNNHIRESRQGEPTRNDRVIVGQNWNV